MTKSLEDYIEEIHLLIRDHGQARVREFPRGRAGERPGAGRAIAEITKLALSAKEP